MSSFNNFIAPRPIQTMNYAPKLALSDGSIPKITFADLLKTISLSSSDMSVQSIYTMDSDYFGLFVSVPSNISSLSIRLSLSVRPLHTGYVKAMSYGTNVEAIAAKRNKMGDIQDFYVNLKEGVNMYEFRIVTGLLDESDVGNQKSLLEFVAGSEFGQSYLLIIQRS